MTKTFFKGAVVALGLALVNGMAAQAQTYDNPNLPRSPYPLPKPTYQGPADDAEDFLFGGGDRVRAPYEWRHWGDTREEGETFKSIFAPDASRGGPAEANSARVQRFCDLHPDRC